jgi:hypothetical protein
MFIADSSCSQVKVGDHVFVGSHDLRSGTQDQFEWNDLQSGMVNTRFLLPEDRSVVSFQIVVQDLLVHGPINLAEIFDRFFGISPEEFARMQFEAVIVLAGADLLAATVYHRDGVPTPPNITISQLLEMMEERIVRLCEQVPGTISIKFFTFFLLFFFNFLFSRPFIHHEARVISDAYIKMHIQSKLHSVSCQEPRLPAGFGSAPAGRGCRRRCSTNFSRAPSCYAASIPASGRPRSTSTQC